MAGSAERFDVIVVGARCAGSPLAAMLARRGLRVCLLDRATFPSDSLSTHVVHPCGVEVLDRLGLLGAMGAAGAVHLTRFTLFEDDARLEAEIDAGGFAAPSICLRRIAMDHLLVGAADAAGAEVRTGSGVTGLLWEDGRVVGVRTRGDALRARLVVGADGRSSTVAALAGSPEYGIEPGGRLFSWAYFEGTGETGAHLRIGTAGPTAYVACPSDGGLLMVAVCPPMSARDRYLADREGGFRAGIEAWPELAAPLAGAERVGPIRVLADWHGYFRQATGPGWVLLGDAGHFKDPSTAQGISDALRQAERLGDAVATGLDAGGPDLDSRLREWWRWRDAEAREMYGFSTDTGSPSSRLLSPVFLRQLAAEPGGGLQFLRVLNRDLPPSGLVTPRRAARAVGGVLRERPGKAPALARELVAELRKEARRARAYRRGGPPPTTRAAAPAPSSPPDR